MSIMLMSELGEAVLTFCLVLFFFAVAITVLVLMKKKFGKDEKMIAKNKPVAIPVTLKKNYMNGKELTFYKTVLNCLPIDFICFPKVPVNQLITPKDNKVMYNTILDDHVDVVIFLRESMEPVLAIDLYDKTDPEQVPELPENIQKALSNAKLPFIKMEAQAEYKIDDVRKKVISAMPAKIMAELKEHYAEK